MDDKEILKRALIQAGMFDNDMFYGEYTYDREWDLSGMKLSHGTYDDYEEISVRDLIFDHGFLKAFFGEQCICNSGSSIPLNYPEIYNHNFEESIRPLLNKNKINEIMFLWEFHLQQMVLEENPIKYLEEFLKEE